MKFGHCKTSTDYRQALFHMYKILSHAFNAIGIFVQILAYTFKKCCKAGILALHIVTFTPVILFKKPLRHVVEVVAPRMPSVSAGSFRICVFNASHIEKFEHGFAIVVSNIFGASLGKV